MNLLSFFHNHVWEDISTNYIAPVETAESDLDRYGYTRLYQKCTGCGEIQDTMKPGHLAIRGVPETVDTEITTVKNLPTYKGAYYE